jgi:hypothetical protein
MPAAKRARTSKAKSTSKKKHPAIVPCAICRKGISRSADLVIKGLDVMHLSCYDGQFGRRSN